MSQSTKRVHDRHLEDPARDQRRPLPLAAVRHHFGIKSFGINAWTGREAGDRLINEHDEEAMSARSSTSSRAGGPGSSSTEKRVDAPAGTFVYAPPGVKRTAFAEEPGSTILAVGATPGEVYEPDGWELWARSTGSTRPGGRARRLTRLRGWSRRTPSTRLLYNLACCESLAGRKAHAIEHLRACDREVRQRPEYLARFGPRSPSQGLRFRRCSIAEPWKPPGCGE